MFSHSKSMETIDLQGMANYDPRAMIGTIYNGDYQTLIHPKYRSSGPCGFKEEHFFFPIVSLWELSVAMETTILIQSKTLNAISPPTQ